MLFSKNNAAQFIARINACYTSESEEVEFTLKCQF